MVLWSRDVAFVQRQQDVEVLPYSVGGGIQKSDISVGGVAVHVFKNHILIADREPAQLLLEQSQQTGRLREEVMTTADDHNSIGIGVGTDHAVYDVQFLLEQ